MVHLKKIYKFTSEPFSIGYVVFVLIVKKRPRHAQTFIFDANVALMYVK